MGSGSDDKKSTATPTPMEVEKDEKVEKGGISVDAQTVEDIREHCRLIERSVVSKESRFMVRVLRSLPNVRKKLSEKVMRRILIGFYTHSTAEKEGVLKYIEKSPNGPNGPNGGDEMEEVPQESQSSSSSSSSSSANLGTGRLRGLKSASNPLSPEVDAYLHLLLLLYLLNDVQKKPKKDSGAAPATAAAKAVECAKELMDKIGGNHNRRSLDHIAAKCLYYYGRSHEFQGTLGEIRPFLHGRLRSATLRNDFEGQAVIINCLLRNYLFYNLYDQADKLVLKATFPENASNNEWARYLYYLGRIKATQLEYTEAHKHLVQSLRKAPQYSALGFRHTVQKLNITVELLLGDIPERQIFLTADNKVALAPYFQLTQAVRSGDIDRFQKTLDTYAQLFRSDHTYTLILRLRHNVIKTAVRTISLAYSRISLIDVAQKLRLDSPEDAEFIIAKAIRDGVIEATLDHENGWMKSKENTDIYCTREPQLAFHQRIEFCLDLHNNSVKAMRFPPKSYNQDLESAEDRREREAQDLELAKEMAEEDDDMI